MHNNCYLLSCYLHLTTGMPSLYIYWSHIAGARGPLSCRAGAVDVSGRGPDPLQGGEGLKNPLDRGNERRTVS